MVLSFVCAALSAAGCGGSGGNSAGTTIVAAFYPIAFAAERIAADDAQVRNLTPAGSEPHDLELSARDVEELDAADYVFFLGASFMPALEDAVRDHERAVDLLQSRRLIERVDEPHEQDSGVDPHVWLDPASFASMAERIGEVLGRPTQAAPLARELRALDHDFREGLSDCDRRTIVTSHAAFGHLTRRYELEQIALTGISPEAEPSARALEALVARVEEAGATTVFFETLVSPKLAETVAREAGVKTAVLNPLEGLTEKEIDGGADYFSVMRDNLAALRRALGCT